jgi:CRP/FNR family transcriptional regulator
MGRTLLSQLLSSVSYFAELDAAIMAAVCRAAIRRQFDAGQVVFLEGEPCAGLYVVQEGWLKSVKMSPAGREQTLRVVGPGEVFNDLTVFVGSPNVVTIIALEPAIVWVIPREVMLRLLDEHPGLARMVVQNLAQRTLHLLTLVEDLSLRPVEARLARLLLEQATAGALPRRRWMTQAEMASRLGTVPDVLNRALRGLVEEGLIQVERHRIQILDRRRLEARAMITGWPEQVNKRSRRNAAMGAAYVGMLARPVCWL